MLTCLAEPAKPSFRAPKPLVPTKPSVFLPAQIPTLASPNFANFFPADPTTSPTTSHLSTKPIDKMAKESPAARSGLIVGINKGHVR